MPWIRDFAVTEVTTASADPSAQVEFPTHQSGDLLLMTMCTFFRSFSSSLRERFYFGRTYATFRL